jgi:hypothetical protein
MLKEVLPDSLMHLHDGSDICSWLDGSGTVARRFPQLLGLRDLEVLLREYLHRDVSERSFTALAKSREIARLCPDTDREPFSVVLSEMTEAFVKRRTWGGIETIDWIHPSCRDLAIDRLSDDVLARRRFLQSCDLDGVRLALSLGGRQQRKACSPLNFRMHTTGTPLLRD